jgi:hypothetical protein
MATMNLDQIRRDIPGLDTNLYCNTGGGGRDPVATLAPEAVA